METLELKEIISKEWRKENIIRLKTYLNKNTEIVDLVQAQHKLKNAGLLLNEKYYLELLLLNESQTKKFTENMTIKELFPLNELECLTTKKQRKWKN
ncbi:hypothetical protein J2795_002800 [Chryseobacterium bernardetii]|uniref:Uncharacterized protein n=2 Tax=Chryseobacterium TaxID=59732 RepID=A0A543EBJ9_9FLAO|nr:MULTISPECIES: hypothetical protein [Chryseobacterium]MDR6371413.1 hypothetical protein [Chryseobacterium vietnamense]MDR6442082.1 hypothetical protein [Chryseobacterium bernardetii]TQM18960.1 hypothetical protein FB551_3355 [Chryseobacterium aquifrigidense]